MLDSFASLHLWFALITFNIFSTPPSSTPSVRLSVFALSVTTHDSSIVSAIVVYLFSVHQHIAMYF